MPVLEIKTEGKGINTYTNLINLKDVAKSLYMPTIYILKFMGYEFGSNTNIKTNNNEIISTTINGI